MQYTTPASVKSLRTTEINPDAHREKSVAECEKTNGKYLSESFPNLLNGFAWRE